MRGSRKGGPPLEIKNIEFYIECNRKYASAPQPYPRKTSGSAHE